MSRITDRQAFEMIQQRAEVLASAGKGLETIGRLLGADDSEHELSEEDRYGLAHAVAAIGALVFERANEAWGYAAPDREQWT